MQAEAFEDVAALGAPSRGLSSAFEESALAAGEMLAMEADVFGSLNVSGAIT
jgi:hypothetical protein